MTVNNCGKEVSIKSFDDASKLIRNHIEKKEMRSSKWYQYKDNGTITDNGKQVASISFNGRIWMN